MNFIESVNKIVGIAFTVALTGFVGYRAYLWRNDMAKEAGKRLQHRIVQMSEDPRYQLPKSEIKWPEVKLPANGWQGVGGGGHAARK